MDVSVGWVKVSIGRVDFSIDLVAQARMDILEPHIDLGVTGDWNVFLAVTGDLVVMGPPTDVSVVDAATLGWWNDVCTEALGVEVRRIGKPVS